MKIYYVFRRLLERTDVESLIEACFNDRFPLSILIVTRDDFDELTFPNSFNRTGSGLIRIVNFGNTGRWDIWVLCSLLILLLSLLLLLLFILLSLFSLSAVVDVELTEEVLEWRLERMVGRHVRKLGLFECAVVANEADDDEYWEAVRWRPPEYVCEEDDNEDEEDVDKAGERRRDEREWRVFV